MRLPNTMKNSRRLMDRARPETTVVQYGSFRELLPISHHTAKRVRMSAVGSVLEMTCDKDSGWLAPNEVVRGPAARARRSIDGVGVAQMRCPAYDAIRAR